jgi:hypothetical protein
MLLADLKDRGDSFLWHVCWLSVDYTMLQVTCLKMYLLFGCTAIPMHDTVGKLAIGIGETQERFIL